MSLAREDFDRFGEALVACFDTLTPGEPTDNFRIGFVDVLGSIAEQIFAREQNPGSKLTNLVFSLISNFWSGIRRSYMETGDAATAAVVLEGSRDVFNAVVADIFADGFDLPRADFDRHVAALLEARTEVAFAAVFCPLAERFFDSGNDPGRSLAKLVLAALFGVSQGSWWTEGGQS